MEKVVEKIRREMRMGFYALLTLKLLRDRGELHGYGIRSEIKRLSGGALNPSEGTIYELLKLLGKKGLIESYWVVSSTGRARKMYRITPLGAEVYKRLCPDLAAFKKIIEYLLEGCA